MEDWYQGTKGRSVSGYGCFTPQRGTSGSRSSQDRSYFAWAKRVCLDPGSFDRGRADSCWSPDADWE